MGAIQKQNTLHFSKKNIFKNQRHLPNPVNKLIILFEKKLLCHTFNNNNAFWLELSNAFDCVSQKENILLNTENKRIIGVLNGLGVC
jgi:hypothetical protein